MWEATIKYVVVDEKTGNDRSIKEQFVCENNDSFTDVEAMLISMFGTYADFSVEAIKRSKIKEVANKRDSEDDMVWMAELQDVFTDDEGVEKYTKYKVVFYAKSADSAHAFITDFMRQGYDMTLVSLKLTNFSDVI